MNDKKAFAEFVTQVLSHHDSATLRKFFKAILTPQELREIPKRMQIIKMLKRGIAQRQIADKLGVGIATVTRGSKELQKGNFAEID